MGWWFPCLLILTFKLRLTLPNPECGGRWVPSQCAGSCEDRKWQIDVREGCPSEFSSDATIPCLPGSGACGVYRKDSIANECDKVSQNKDIDWKRWLGIKGITLERSKWIPVTGKWTEDFHPLPEYITGATASSVDSSVITGAEISPIIENGRTRSDFARAVLYSPATEDISSNEFFFRVDFSVISGTTAGILWNFQDADHFYSVYFTAIGECKIYRHGSKDEPGDNMYLLKSVTGQRHYIADSMGKKSHTVEIYVRNYEHSIYLDGELQGTVKDCHYPNGGLLGVSTMGSKVSFGNFRVGIPVNNLFFDRFPFSTPSKETGYTMLREKTCILADCPKSKDMAHAMVRDELGQCKEHPEPCPLTTGGHDINGNCVGIIGLACPDGEHRLSSGECAKYFIPCQDGYGRSNNGHCESLLGETASCTDSVFVFTSLLAACFLCRKIYQLCKQVSQAYAEQEKPLDSLSDLNGNMNIVEVNENEFDDTINKKVTALLESLSHIKRYNFSEDVKNAKNSTRVHPIPLFVPLKKEHRRKHPAFLHYMTSYTDDEKHGILEKMSLYEDEDLGVMYRLMDSIKDPTQFGGEETDKAIKDRRPFFVSVRVAPDDKEDEDAFNYHVTYHSNHETYGPIYAMKSENKEGKYHDILLRIIHVLYYRYDREYGTFFKELGESLKDLLASFQYKSHDIEKLGEEIEEHLEEEDIEKIKEDAIEMLGENEELEIEKYFQDMLSMEKSRQKNEVRNLLDEHYDGLKKLKELMWHYKMDSEHAGEKLKFHICHMESRDRELQDLKSKHKKRIKELELLSTSAKKRKERTSSLLCNAPLRKRKGKQIINPINQ
eukprot:g125.t1